MILVKFVSILVLVSLTTGNIRRQYFSDEDEPYPRKYLVLQDEYGNLAVNDLSDKRIEVEVLPSDIRLNFYSQNNREDGFEIKVEEFDGVVASEYFNADKISFFSIHGHGSAWLSESNKLIRDAILSKYDVNIFLVDWSVHSRQFYTNAVLAVPKVGAILGDAIKKMIQHYNIPTAKINIAGHSLGAHVGGAVGAFLNGEINYILGTDPALPLFSYNDTDTRLDKTDAKFVQVIHGNGGLLGFRSSLGHADYFPNGGGMNQPGCGSDLFGSCAHSRAYKYYAESILSSNFSAKLCTSYEDFEASFCEANNYSNMGEFFLDTEALGDYYLNTAEESPFALGGGM